MEAYTRLSDLLASGGQDPVDLYSSAESGLSGLSGLSVGVPGKGHLDNTLETHRENQSFDDDATAKPTPQHTAAPSISSGSRDGMALYSDGESGPQQQRRTQFPSVPPAPIGRRMISEAEWDEMRVSPFPSSKRAQLPFSYVFACVVPKQRTTAVYRYPIQFDSYVEDGLCCFPNTSRPSLMQKVH